MSESALPRMRTVDGLYMEIHRLDPESQVKRNFLRQLIITKKIKSVKAGNKYLANLEEVLKYLASPPEEKEEPKVEEYGRLRKVEG